MPQVPKIKATDNLKESIRQAVDALGGISSFVKAGETVLLKPNFNTDDPFPASTDIGFLKAVVELAYEAGAGKIIIGESSTWSLATNGVMNSLGVFDLRKMQKPPEIVNFDEGNWVKKKIPGGKYLKSVSVPETLEKADKLILLPCLKTHCYAQYTGALKLSVGFMKKPFQRLALHARNKVIQQKIAELNLVIHPDLVIIDARKCFINGGPCEGEVREPGLIMASASRVDIDIESVKIIQSYEGNSLKGLNPEELTQIKFAKELKLK